MNAVSGLFQRKWIKIPGLLLLVVISLWVGSMLGGNSSSVTTDDHNHEEGEEGIEWTCSMHPQIKMPKEGQCPICFMDLIPLEKDNSVDDGIEATRLSMSENAKKLAGITTVPAIRENVETGIRITGKVAFDETRVEMISSRIAGRIDKLYVDYTGAAVSDGDKLADIYSPELVTLQRELIEAVNAVRNTENNSNDLMKTAAQRTLDAAKNKLRLLGFSAQDVSLLINNRVPTDHMTIRAGQRGVVIRKLVEEGSYIQTGTPIVHIADLSKVWVMLDAYESDIAWIRIGQRVEFTVEAYPGVLFNGTVAFIDPVVNPATRTVKVRVNAYNERLRLKPDMFVKASLQAGLPKTAEGQNRIIIPATAPLYTGERSLVYVEIPGLEEPTYEARDVVLGPKVGKFYVVNSGVLEGERVVVNGAFKIDGELQIRARPSMMNPPSDVAATVSDNGLSSIKLLPPSKNSSKQVSKEFITSLKKFTATYIELAEALANDDLVASKNKMGELSTSLAGVTSSTSEAYDEWRSAKKEIQKALVKTDQVTEILYARQVFDLLSQQIISLEKSYLADDGTNHYLAYCPMAFDNSGAYWIQTDETINNPYFGASMLRCGEIKGTL